MKSSFELAVRNVATWGDTDVFPFAPEGHIFHDRVDEVTALLLSLHSDFKDRYLAAPPTGEVALQLITTEGFRWASQIDPIWNAYLLGLVIEAAPAIEAKRMAWDRNVIFSYRFEIDRERASLFRSHSWADFATRSEELAKENEFVVVADIADFYGRIYHHRVENSLQELKLSNDTPKRLDKILGDLAGGVSYGLPVGGPAARALSELTLARVDTLLDMEGIVFCRFADDYRLFAKTEQDAYRQLIILTEYLMEHEGATLQKQKTRVVKSKDFLRAPLFVAEDTTDLTHEERQERKFVRLSLRYDPYSTNAEADYERLRQELEEFDILDMLSREISKSRVNVPVVRRIALALKFVAEDVQEAAVGTIVDNLEMLAPAMPVVLRVLDDLAAGLPPDSRAALTGDLRRRLSEGAYYLSLPMNTAYAFRVLRHENTEENLALARAVYDSGKAPAFLQRDIVLHMHNWGSGAFVSRERRRYFERHPWVQRAIMMSSFILGDEGRHWRRSLHLSPFDAIARDWRAEKVNSGREDIPL
jgi:hypothetical protein